MPLEHGKSKKAFEHNLKADKVNENKVNKALEHPNKLGAGARKRENLNAPEKKESVMKEFAHHKLHSGSGEIVTNPKQAMAIGYSEAGEHKKKDNVATSEHLASMAQRRAQGALQQVKKDREAKLAHTAKSSSIGFKENRIATAHKKLQDKMSFHHARKK